MSRHFATWRPTKPSIAIKEMPQAMLLFRTIHRKAAAAVGLAVAIMLLALGAAPAMAAPEFDVEIERDQAVVSHSDERVDYTAKMANIAAPSASDTLVCDTNSAKWNNATSFTFEWLSNGIAASGPTTIPTPTTSTYQVQNADEGHLIQCVVIGVNAGSKSASFSNPMVIPPAPTAVPQFGNEENRPAIAESTASAGTVLTCNAPIGWAGGSISWTFEWLGNGIPLGSAHVTETTATTSKYEVQASDVPGVLQCKATGKIGSGAPPDGGTAIAISANQITSPGPSPIEPNNGIGENRPFLSVPSKQTNGTVSLEVELPGGDETYAYEIVAPGFNAASETGKANWASCITQPTSQLQHATVRCDSSVPSQLGTKYAPIRIVTALGADAPDVAIAKATAFGGGVSAPVSAKDEFLFDPLREFGLAPETFKTALHDCEGHDFRQAGGHPCVGVGNFELTKKRTLTIASGPGGEYSPVEHAKQVIVDLPRGQVGNALAVPELCSGVEAVLALPLPTCPDSSMVGVIDIVVRGAGLTTPIFAIEPEFGTPAQFAFREPLGNVFTLSARLRPNDGYAVSLDVAPPPKIDFLSSVATICGFGVKKVNINWVCRKPEEPGANPKPLFTNPGRCGSPAPVVKARLRSWEHPEVEKTFSFTNPEIIGCENVKFEPKIDLQPSSAQADSPTGLDVSLAMPTDGLEKPDGIAQANLKRAKITFPKGMAVNATAGRGLGSCSAGQIKLGTNEAIECPDSSKIGTVDIKTPILEDTLHGAVYIAKQGDVDGSLIGFYLVFDSPKNGILVKIPAKVTPDPVTGQLTVTVDDSPEAPFSAVHMHFPGGPQATLLNPPKCGSYEIEAELTPWSGGPAVPDSSPFEVTSGPGGGSCPTGELDPKLNAGPEKPVAGKASPFLLRLSREDGTQRFSALSLTTPPGLTAYLKGIPYCPDSVLGSISSTEGTGQAQIDHPSCPTASQIGTASAGAGAGPDPLFVDTGKAYLAGPYKGAPLSLALVAPAVAGPLDLGNVVVRTALRVNPKTAQITAVSDPIPTILHGILLDIRDIRVAIDRPHFTLNPTNCEPMSVGVDVKGEGGANASRFNRFQVGGCDKLAFKPKLGVRLFGGTHRGGHPRLRGTLEARPGDANIGRAAVTIPRSEFLDQAHIRTICTRVQFAASACPPGSIYGHATATTPLLDYPVEGPVYLRSSDHKLPDLVVDLHGPAYQPIEAEVVGRIDSIKGQIRTTFENTPDVPLTKFTLSMQGGKKGLLINSRNICADANRATVKMSGQNGATSNNRPVLTNSKCNKGHKARR